MKKLFVSLLVAFLLTIGSVNPVVKSEKLDDLRGNKLINIQSISEQDTILDVCLTQEPDSLYLYGDYTIWSSLILEAIYAGPIRIQNFEPQPIILTRVPSLENGGAVIKSVTVQEGDRVINDEGAPIDLAVGAMIRPSGCYSSDCAIEYNGGPIQMDQMEVTYEFLQGLTWSDGHPLSAADSVYSFNLYANEATPTEKYSVQRTANYYALGNTQVVWVGLPGFVTNDYSTYLWNPLPEHIWGAYTPGQLLSAEVSTRKPLGWGPYMIEEWISGDRIVMKKNPNYFRAREGLPAFEQLIVHFTSDPLGGTLSGTCDVVLHPEDSPKTLLEYHDEGKINYVRVASNGFEHIDFNLQPKSGYGGDFFLHTDNFQDVRVRQAFAYCLDREAIADSSDAIVGHAYVPTTSPYFPEDATIYPHDPAQGRQLLSEAGWIDSNGNGIRDKNGVEFSVRLLTTTSAARTTTSNLIKSQMLNNCGIEVIPDQRPEAFDLIFDRQYDLALFTWLTGPQPPCDLYVSGGVQNNIGYSNPEFDEACRRASSTFDEEEKLFYHQEALRIFTRDLPSVILYFNTDFGYSAPHIAGLTLDSSNNAFWNVEEIKPSVSELVKEAGGTTTFDEGNVVLQFPEGLFDKPTWVSYVTTSQQYMPGVADGVGRFFEILASNIDGFATPSGTYTMTTTYSEDQVVIGQEDTLALYYWDEELQQWIKEPTSQVDVQNNLVTATPDHFSLWAVLYPPKQRFIPLLLR